MKRPEDKGLTEKWYSPSYQPKEWHRIAIPGFWADEGAKNLNGVVWYRREINVPASMTNVAAKVFLGRIVDADELYINGIKVGSTGYMYPQRRYPIPENVLKPGKNLFVIRVTSNFDKGGFVPDKPYELIAGNDTIDLTGYWQYKVGLLNEPHRGGRGFGGFGIALQNQPTALYNSMIAPLINYAIKGFVWYQGESNTSKSDEYAKLQPAMITDWRSKWNEGDLPFLFVQLPGFGDYNYLPSESQWLCSEKRRQNHYPFPTQRWLLRLIWANGTTFIPTAKNLLATGLPSQPKKLLTEKTSCMQDRYINLQKRKAIKSLFLSSIQAKA
jgi:sialate O-acetylesterase